MFLLAMKKIDQKFLFEDVKSVPYMEFLISDMDIANFKPDTVLMIAKKFMEINGMQRPIPLESPGIKLNYRSLSFLVRPSQSVDLDKNEWTRRRPGLGQAEVISTKSSSVDPYLDKTGHEKEEEETNDQRTKEGSEAATWVNG
ncbi:hypothetical protein L5515_019016 [Caenorhabditis briggsae]|uniref:Uncharacterized protein n=1 Tax=Caenorhabditis briggsae TaxID=6238 RepID=A0AAE9FD62_CAEBR|nr:hypothetical protein L5515_019016 [Caenorhabditis briggsae]